MEIFSPAKINLFLQIIGKRPDGYHDIHSLMCCITLYDKIYFNFNTSNIRVSCSHPEVPEDKSNIAHKAARCFFQSLGSKHGVSINIEKNIPVAAGLGGGSSNAASVLLALNEHYGNFFSQKKLCSLALTLGADVPFFIHKKPAIATGVGEKLEFIKEIQAYHIILIYPGISVKTSEVYKSLNLRLTNCEQKLKDYSLSKKFSPSHLCNDLETVTAFWHPEISYIKNALLDHGALGALMTGSGPAVFGIFDEKDTARKACEVLSSNRGWKCFITRLQV